MSPLPSSHTLLARKRFIFVLVVGLSCFTSMSKVLIPGTIFDQLQHDLGLSAHTLSQMSSCYMYTYAVAQLVAGVLASSLGGIRILMIGGFAFSAGMLAFPMLSTPWAMLLTRAVTGFGAGLTFIVIANLTMELYRDRFTSVLGIALVIGYLGPVIGLSPMVALVQLVGWRIAMLVPAAIAALLYLGAMTRVPGTLSPLAERPALIRPLRETMCHWGMAALCLASAILFGIYYALQTVMGRKCLEDIFGLQPRWSALFLTALALIVAIMNFFAGPIQKCFKNGLKPVMPIASALGLAGAGLGWLALRNQSHPTWLMLAAFLCICIPAGCFPLYCTIAKDDTPPQHAALAVALVNFWAFVLIAVTGNLAGRLMAAHEGEAVKVAETLIYPPAAYVSVFTLFLAVALVGLLCAAFLCTRRQTVDSHGLPTKDDAKHASK